MRNSSTTLMTPGQADRFGQLLTDRCRKMELGQEDAQFALTQGRSFQDGVEEVVRRLCGRLYEMEDVGMEIPSIPPIPPEIQAQLPSLQQQLLRTIKFFPTRQVGSYIARCIERPDCLPPLPAGYVWTIVPFCEAKGRKNEYSRAISELFELMSSEEGKEQLLKTGVEDVWLVERHKEYLQHRMLSLTDHTRAGLQKVWEGQGRADFLLLPVCLWSYPKRSARRAQELIRVTPSEFGLGLFEMGTIALLCPELVRNMPDIGIASGIAKWYLNDYNAFTAGHGNEIICAGTASCLELPGAGRGCIQWATPHLYAFQGDGDQFWGGKVSLSWKIERTCRTTWGSCSATALGLC